MQQDNKLEAANSGVCYFYSRSELLAEKAVTRRQSARYAVFHCSPYPEYDSCLM